MSDDREALKGVLVALVTEMRRRGRDRELRDIFAAVERDALAVVPVEQHDVVRAKLREILAEADAC